LCIPDPAVLTGLPAPPNSLAENHITATFDGDCFTLCGSFSFGVPFTGTGNVATFLLRNVRVTLPVAGFPPSLIDPECTSGVASVIALGDTVQSPSVSASFGGAVAVNGLGPQTLDLIVCPNGTSAATLTTFMFNSFNSVVLYYTFTACGRFIAPSPSSHPRREGVGEVGSASFSCKIDGYDRI